MSLSDRRRTSSSTPSVLETMIVILIAVTCIGVHSTLSESVSLDVSTYGYSVLTLLAVVGLSRLGLVYSVIQSTFVLELEST